MGSLRSFEGKNFMLRKFKVKALYKAREIWGLVSGEEIKP
jgi:hypothetical protein